MKKLFLGVLGIFISGIITFNNPIESYWAEISELYFDNSGNWFIEIELGTAGSNDILELDSICITSNAGRARIKSINSIDYCSYPVITSDSLSSPLAINKYGDHLTLIIYPADTLLYSREDQFIFGNQTGSVLDSINQGYSVVCINHDYYTKDCTPSLELPNDTSGVCATLTGYVYDKNNNIVTDSNLVLVFPLYYDETGRFVTKILSRTYYFTNIDLWRSGYKVFLTNPFGAPITYLDISPLSFKSNPGDIIERNIYLTDFISGTESLEEITKPEIGIRNYPNPFNSSTSFYITIPTNMQNEKGYIKIYNVTGEEVDSIPINGKTNIRWNGTDSYGRSLSSGIYYYQFSLKNKIRSTGSMILLK